MIKFLPREIETSLNGSWDIFFDPKDRFSPDDFLTLYKTKSDSKFHHNLKTIRFFYDTRENTYDTIYNSNNRTISQNPSKISEELLDGYRTKINMPAVFNTIPEGAGYKGVVWYMREIALPQNSSSSSPEPPIYELFLEGWYGRADIFVNFQYIGGREHGYTPFSLFFRLNSKDNNSPNNNNPNNNNPNNNNPNNNNPNNNNPNNPKVINILIKIDNREQKGQTFKSMDFRAWGGIHRDIKIRVLPSFFIKNVLFDADLGKQNNDPHDTHNNANTYKIKARIIALTPSLRDYQDNNNNDNNDLNLTAEGVIINSDTSQSIILKQQKSYLLDTKINEENSWESLYPEYSLHYIKELPAVIKNETKIGTITPNNNITNSVDLKRVVFILKAEAPADPIQEWSIDSPKLYKLNVYISWQVSDPRGATIIHSKIINIGFRTLRSDDKGRLLLNNKPFLLLGVNRHDEHPEFGPAFIPELISRDLTIMKQNGFTGLRPAHYPTTEFFLDTCDRLGLAVMEEIPNYIMTPQMMKDPDVLERGKTMLRDIILAHYNHPSLLIWSLANECKSHLPESKEMINNLIKLGRKFDKYRFYHFTGYPGIQNIAEIDANVVGINVYYGDSVSGKNLEVNVLRNVMENLREFMEDEDIDMKDVPIFITEFGSQTVYGYHDLHPYGRADAEKGVYTIYSEERQAFVIEKFYEQVMDLDYVNGLLVWCWRDNRYEPEIAKSSSGAIMRYGILDVNGNPKLAFYVLKKMIKKLKESRML